MAIRWPSSRAAVALLLLALAVVPLAREAIAAADRHSCCPPAAPAADSRMPCQHVAALECCAQLGVPATPTGDGPRALPMASALVAVTPLLPPPPAWQFVRTRNAHGPPQASQLRSTVLRL